MGDAGSRARRIDLAGVEDFRLGGLLIRPSTCRVADNEGEVRVEPKVMEALVVLRRANGGTVTREQLIEECWGGRVVSDDAITRMIAKVRRLAANGGAAHFTIETLPKLGFRLIVPPAPEAQCVNTAPTGPTDAPARSTRRRFLQHKSVAGTAGAFAVMVTIVAVWLARTPSTTDIIQPGLVAVSAFTPLQRGGDLARLSAQATEAASWRLSLSSVRTVATGRAGEAALAEYEVGGTVDRVADRYIVTSWIRDRRSGAIVWSRRLDRRAADVAGFDEEVGRTVGRPLSCAAKQRALSPRPLAHEQLVLLLNACGSVLSDTDHALDVTRRLLDSAPDFAGAHALRALAFADAATMDDYIPTEQRMFAVGAEREARRALALNPRTALAHLALGYRVGDDPRIADREHQLLQAIELDPDLTTASFDYIELLREVGRVQAAREFAFRIVHASGRPAAIPQLALLFASLGDPDVDFVIRQIEALDPTDAGPTRWVGLLWWSDPRTLGEDFWARGRELFSARATECDRVFIRVLVAARGAPLRGLPAECDGLTDNDLPLDYRVRMLAREGDVDGAYALLEKSLPNSRSAPMFLFYPEMRQLRQDPRFLKVAERFSLLKYWRQTRQWPDFCHEEKPNYACR